VPLFVVLGAAVELWVVAVVDEPLLAALAIAEPPRARAPRAATPMAELRSFCVTDM
jgi:hypothetical protein